MQGLNSVERGMRAEAGEVRSRLLAPAVICFFAVFLLAPSGLSSQDAVKSPVPPQLSQDASLKQIRSVYTAEYAKAEKRSKAAIAAKRSLSEALLKAGVETGDDAVIAYSLFDESRKMALEAAAVDLALDALSAMIQRYEFDPMDLQFESFQRLAQRVKSPDDNWSLSHAVRVVAQDCFGKDDFDTAEKFIKLVSRTAARSGDKALSLSISALGKRIKALDKIYSAVEKKLKKLTGPAADLELGRYCAFSKGDWKAGLPLLQKGSVGSLGITAAADLKADRESLDSEGAVKIGDAWWGIAEGERDKLMVENIKLRAGSFYELGVEDLVPLDKKRVSGRLREIAKLRKSSGGTKESYLAGLVAALSFDPGTVSGEGELKTCRDLSGSGNDGTFSGGKAVRGKVGGGLSLNGSGERVVIAHKDELALEQGSTVSMWFKPGSSLGRGLDKTQVLFSKGYVDRDLAYCLLFSDEGEGTMTGAFSERQYVSSNQNSWPSGKWAHVTMTLALEGDDHVARLYINGTLNDTNDLRRDPRGTLSNISVGAMDSSGRRSFKGVIDEVAVWDRPLAAAEVLALYKDSSRGKSYCAAASR